MECRAILGHDSCMGSRKWAVGGAAVFIVGAGLGLFLVSEGLVQASAWVTVLGFPLVLAGTVAGVWSAVQAARRGRQNHPGGISQTHTGHGDNNLTVHGDIDLTTTDQ